MMCMSHHRDQAVFDIFAIPAMLEAKDEAKEDDDANEAVWIRGFDSMSFARLLPLSILRPSVSALVPQRVTGAAAAAVASDSDVTGSKDDDNKLDVMAMYAEYCRLLRSKVTRRPWRGLFLDITALLEELSFLWVMFETALKRVDKYLEETDTAMKGSSDVQGPFGKPRLARVEHEYMLRERAALNTECQKVYKLIMFTESLQRRVKQMVEVMDEGNDKSIHVFTVVTVLFLPLTFVSGFFGMNTIDIRDIDADQTLYWTVAIPVTLVTLCATLVYAYKGGEIRDKLHEKLHEKSGRSPAAKETGKTEKTKLSIKNRIAAPSERPKGSVRDRIRRRLRREKRTETVGSDVV
ncbi:hypothetical protein VTJ49DRAFT_1095 [Mycothermus thermophilus]|uniref:Uncharacterized protein n=1 Tax=Humicola insolens TaxID=85995 RepID=A0ABR3VEH8_HUMIN